MRFARAMSWSVAGELREGVSGVEFGRGSVRGAEMPRFARDSACDGFHKGRAVGIALPSESSDNSARVTLPHLTNPLVLAQ